MATVSNTKKVEILMQPFLSRKDIMQLLGIGENKASEIVKEIYKHLAAEGKKPYTPKAHLVASQTFLNFMGWKLSDFVKNAKIEQQLKITGGGA
jgi:hypothetical protein